MRAVAVKLVLVLVALSLVSACSRNREPKLLNIKSSTQGPDEFSILPGKPLEAPTDFTALPPPNPGGTNRTDVTPKADAIAALGGNPAAVSRGIPAADAGLVNYAARNGVDPTIRQQLAREDLEFRRRNNGRILERAFNVNVYFRAYRKLSLDQHRELERFRRAGVRTPSAPPEKP